MNNLTQFITTQGQTNMRHFLFLQAWHSAHLVHKLRYLIISMILTTFALPSLAIFYDYLHKYRFI